MSCQSFQLHIIFLMIQIQQCNGDAQAVLVIKLETQILLLILPLSKLNSLSRQLLSADASAARL
jgi:hypothetical protein